MRVHSDMCAASETYGTGEIYAISNGTSKTKKTCETDGTGETKKTD